VAEQFGMVIDSHNRSKNGHTVSAVTFESAANLTQRSPSTGFDAVLARSSLMICH
jgi:hypothetical protein